MSKVLKTEVEQFAFSDTIKDLDWKVSTDDEDKVRKELFGENFDPDKLIDKFEEQTGIKSASTKPANVVYKSVMLSPGDDNDDAALLYQLMNDKELYPMLQEKSNWTPKGEYKMFIIYGENQDVKTKRAANAAAKQEAANHD